MASRRRGQAPPPESVPPLTALPPGAGPALRTYQVMNVTMRPGHPLTFSDGEQVIAVLSSGQVPLSIDWRLTVLVEMP